MDGRGRQGVSIEGGEEAERRRKAIDGVANATVIGEFAFGTSEKSPFGSPSEKGRIGTVHFALGDNHNAYPGGQNPCLLHLDGVFLNASLQIEDTGEYIIKDGESALSSASSRSTTTDPIELPQGSWSRMLVMAGGESRGERVVARLLGLHAGDGAHAGEARDRGSCLQR